MRFSHLLLNGLYWGLYQVEERPDAAFMADYVGGDRYEWDALSAGELKDGNLDAWEELLGMMEKALSGTANYSAVEQQLDLTAFADCILLEATLGNLDWPDRNWWAVRQRADGAKWQFLVWDSEMTMSELSNNLLDEVFAETSGAFFHALRQNPEFRVLFGDRAQRHLFNQDALTGGAMVARWNELSLLVVPGILGSPLAGGTTGGMSGRSRGPLCIPTRTSGRRKSIGLRTTICPSEGKGFWTP